MILAGAWKARSVKGPTYPDVAHVSHGEKIKMGMNAQGCGQEPQ